MRKFLVAAIAAVAVLAVAGIALAANVYTVDGKTKPAGKGSANKPKPVSLDFEYTVADEDPALRGSPVKQYRIGAEGLVTYPEKFPTCSGDTSAANASTEAAAQAACRKARVGGGTITALVGANASPTSSQNCVLKLNLYNLKPGNYGEFGKIGKNGGLAIRLDADPPAPPTLDPANAGQCLAPQHAAILAPYVAVKIAGVKADELRFTVPANLLHPAAGLDIVVRKVDSAVKKITAKKKIKGKNRKIGFYSAVGCKGSKRSIQVTFVSEDGQKTPKTKEGRC